MYDRSGELLGARVAADGQWRFPPGGDINPKFAAAIIEFEDRRFRYHPGIDPVAVCRAAVQNIRSGKIVSGGSTITMQTIRLMRGNKKRTFGEKIIEAVLAVRLEIGRSKDDVLALYAANAPFGGNVVGLDAAAWRWYGRSALELSWGEAATLAVLPNGPGLVHPGRNRDVLRRKRDALLYRLAEKGYMDEQTLLLAQAEPLPGSARELPRAAPHLFERMAAERRKSAPAGGQSSGFPGARKGLFAEPLVTTIDGSLQNRVTDILERSAYRFSGNNILNAACLVLDTGTGEVLAYVGNVNSPVAGDVDVIASPRSSGSILKPFLYAAMLDSGELMPQGLVSDIPTRIGSYRPENNTRIFTGVVPADQALARSLNIPAVRALREYGIERFAALLQSMGITTLFRPPAEYGLPLILGGAEVTLWDISGLYAGLARTVMERDADDSRFFPPTILPRSPDVPRGKPRGKPPISPGAAWLTLEALTSAVRPAEEVAWRIFAGSHNIAWKTGTSFGFRDAWAVGTTSKWTVAVWVGNATGEGRSELYGANTAAPVLFEVFSALSPASWFQKPSGELRAVEVCARSGYPAGADCESLKYAEVPRNAPYHGPCPFCKTLVLNEALDRQVILTGDNPERIVTRKWFVLPPAEEWYYRRWNLEYKPPPPGEDLHAASGGTASGTVFPMAIFNPEENSQVYVPVELDGAPGKIVFMAAHRDSGAVIHWHLDGGYLGGTTLFHEMEARPAPGNHVLTIIDSGGNVLSRRFSVPDRAD
jgi:penicillin-binding protein 1C